MEHESLFTGLVRKHSDNYICRNLTSARFPCDVRVLAIVILATLLYLNYSSNCLNNAQEFKNIVKSDALGYSDDAVSKQEITHLREDYTIMGKNTPIPEWIQNDNTIDSYKADTSNGDSKTGKVEQLHNKNLTEAEETGGTQLRTYTTSESESEKMNMDNINRNPTEIYTNSSPTDVRTLATTISGNLDPEENTMACQLPKLNAFDPNIKEFWEKPAESFSCMKAHPLLFHTDLDSNLIVKDSTSWPNFTDCCYKELFRAKGTDDSKYNVSSNCEPIVSNITKIPSTMQYIVVYCINKPSKNLTLIDMFHFVNLKPDLEERCEQIEATEKSARKDALNVIILGLDSLSRLNFIRTMPKTHAFISKKLSAISMEGLTKVGDNTLPVLLPGLAGMSLAEANQTCFGKSKYFDTCPLIWKNFTDAGYRTSFGEDAPNMAIFNYMLNGFKTPPTDYYLRPMMKALKNTMGYLKSLNVHLCYGPRIPFEILLDFMKKTAYTLRNKKKYFQLIWSSTMSHDLLNNPKMGDETLFQTLEWLQTEDYLNNTVLILLSDHGMRFGKFRDTYQGSIEARMPYWFTIFPKWFTQKYSKAVKIFRRNVYRLTTHYDFHETLLDLLHLDNIADIQIEEKVKRFELDTKQGKIPRGISLFLPIPLSRNCSTAEIPEHYCVCNAVEPMPVYIYTVDPDILSATKAVIKFINKITSPYLDCAPLKLKNVTSALKATSVSKNTQEKMDKQINANDTVSYIINFMTIPGDASFEASAFGSPTQGNWVVSGEISRTNLYGNQSHCVNDKILKKYCYCHD